MVGADLKNQCSDATPVSQGSSVKAGRGEQSASGRGTGVPSHNVDEVFWGN